MLGVEEWTPSPPQCQIPSITANLKPNPHPIIPLSSPLILPSPQPFSPGRQIDIPAADVAVVVHSNLPCGVYLVGAGPQSGWLSLLLTKAVNL